jgi:hypothetical protein
MKTIKPNNRRNFLIAASLGGAGAVAAATARNKPKVAAAEPAAARADGYQATPHVLKYYKTAEV